MRTSLFTRHDLRRHRTMRTGSLLLSLFFFAMQQHALAQEENALPWVPPPSAWDTAPRFPGGPQAWQRYLDDSLRYPADEAQARRHGLVFATVLVDTLGRIAQVRITNGVPGAPAFAREAERLLGSMPPWLPATKGGRPVPAEVQLSVHFMPGGRRPMRR